MIQILSPVSPFPPQSERSRDHDFTLGQALGTILVTLGWAGLGWAGLGGVTAVRKWCGAAALITGKQLHLRGHWGIGDHTLHHYRTLARK